MIGVGSPPKKWAIFISGQGSNLQSLIDAGFANQIVMVVSNKALAKGLERAKKAGCPTMVLDQPVDWSDLSEKLKRAKVEFIFLLGFMKIVPADFIDQWSGRILNLHPSLLPLYKGLNAIERSYNERAAMGVTVHWVTADLDEGPILLQEILYKAGEAQGRPLDLVTEEIHRLEHQLVVQVVKKMEDPSREGNYSKESDSSKESDIAYAKNGDVAKSDRKVDR